MAQKEIHSNSKVMVIGTSGAGKSTFARSLSKICGLRDIELDALYWEPHWVEAPIEVFRRRIESEIAKPGGWVIHGNYNKVRDLTWGSADTLVWLDYSRPVVFWRVIKRTIVRLFSRELLWETNRESFRKNFLSKESIILWSINTYALRKKQYTDFINRPEYSHLKVVRFKHPREAKMYLENICS